jgi:cation-transporting ATPase 13A1
MELSLAVTNSLADLIKRKIFCTEAFRIPLAGQVDVCCFDKTGTLTVDQIFLTGISLSAAGNDSIRNEIDLTDLQEPPLSLPWPTLRIMVACHSLAVKSSAGTSSSSREDDLPLIGDPLEKAVMEKTGYKVVHNNAIQKVSGNDGPETMLVLQRFGFSSKLKRMSTVVRESGSDKTWVLTKGAPETIKNLLRPSAVPADYDEVSMRHMALGKRVLAIAYREMTPKETKISVKEIDRAHIESDLIFAGFLLFRCPIKHDSKTVIDELKQSGNNVVMITGDAMLTAVEVGRQVSIIPTRGNVSPPALQLQYVPSGGNSNEKKEFLRDFEFVPFPGQVVGLGTEKLTLHPSGMDFLRKKTRSEEVVLCIAGDVLQKLVSVAVEDSESKSLFPRYSSDEKQILLHPEAQALLKDIVPLIQIYARHAPRQKEAVIAAFNLAGFKTLMCGDGTNDVGALRRAHVGISLISAPEIEAKQRSAVQNIAKAQKKEKKTSRGKGRSATQQKSVLEKSLRQLQEAQDELDQIDLGDASIASPFTSRVASISCCRDVLKQGRCTLVTMLQIYKILGINCLVNATILSKLFLHGVKQGDRQMTALGLIVAALFFFVTRGKPLPTLSATRPPTSVLCPQAILSIASQFSIHFLAMIVATEVALSFVDPYDPSLIPDGPFNPNTLNTCTFLVSVLATVNTFAVNYRGKPFVEPLRKNKMLWRSLQTSYVLLSACTFEVFPPLNDIFQLAEFPDTTTEPGEWTEQTKSHNAVMSFLTKLVRSTGFPVFLFGLMVVDTFLAFSSEWFILKFFENKS